MNLFDIIGPVMVGPSSSHTAGAVRLGNLAKAILNEPVSQATIGLHGSFAQTGQGHGTDLALIAGLMGWATDDLRIPEAFDYAKQTRLSFTFQTINFGDAAHPNIVRFELKGIHGAACEVVGTSVGGGRVVINEVDGFPLEFSGEYPTLLTMHEDQPGAIALVTGILSQHGVNIAQMRVFRRKKGGLACMVVETDQPIANHDFAALLALPMVHLVRRIEG
jgi:L-serine dehydratase